MAPWFFVLLFLMTKAHATMTNQIDLQAAMDQMRLKSYHGFTILLKILNSTTKTLQNSNITFFMPTDQELSQADISPNRLKDFVLSHSIPTALLLNNLLHFPNGSLVPSSIPNRMIRITNCRKMGVCVNNARIITPNVCLTSSIRCHGISSAISYDKTSAFSDTLPAKQSSADIIVQRNEMNGAKSSESGAMKKNRSLH
ncbi:hypothetical protein IC582_000979 [Cucumis melo]|uniref:Fasciclin-like arabinogalactan protein 19 n=2 Tax=Cucumis melo TaxID=3656 RepID=A0A5D3E7C1_CUCMM|nr:fasciclin-like arabinogalactan protein 19 [Cucumis melo var. makuwa]TYK31576.1 fasciclin-like arabinogalactan protein 19 [Cucumis melo var. makuwa]